MTEINKAFFDFECALKKKNKLRTAGKINIENNELLLIFFLIIFLN